MKRREFIALVGGAAVGWPLGAAAQLPDRIRRIGMLFATGADDALTQHNLSIFRNGLARLGWTEGKNVRIEYRFAGDADRLPNLAEELVNLQPDAILAYTTLGVTALMRATPNIPIVFVNVSDPVGTGIVRSLASPGGNITGFASAVLALSGKWLELLREIDPRISRAGLMFNPETTAGRVTAMRGQFVAAAALLRIEPIVAEVRNNAEIEAAIAALAREPKGGLVVANDLFNALNRTSIIALSAQHRVPAIYPFNIFSLEGGLVSYGVDIFFGTRQAASYISRILKGERPGDLPVQQPTKFELIINLKAAKALDLTIPATLLARADEVID